MIGWIFRKIFTRPGGLIAGYRLQTLWMETLTAADRKAVRKCVNQPMGAFQQIDDGPPRTLSRMTQFEFLCKLTAWFIGPASRPIGTKFALAAETVPAKASSVLDLHCSYTDLVNFWMRSRKENPEAELRALHIAEAMVAIEQKAAIAWKKDDHKFGGAGELPGHAGFDALCRIYSKRGDSESSATFAMQAKKRQWAGNWEKFL